MTKLRSVVAALCPVFAAECTDLKPVRAQIDGRKPRISTRSSAQANIGADGAAPVSRLARTPGR